MSYISNKFKLEKKFILLYVLFWIVNFVFLQLSLTLLLKIISTRNNEEFSSEIKRQVSNDPFFIQRTDLIISSMRVILVVIIVFSCITLILIRNMQLKSLYTQLGVYMVVGYDDKKIYLNCLLEPLLEAVIAYPISVGLSIFLTDKLNQIELIKSLLLLFDRDSSFNVYPYIVSFAVLLMMLLIHNYIFVKKVKKKGIRYLLGKGVV